MARQVRAVADKHAAFGGFEGGGAQRFRPRAIQGLGVARRAVSVSEEVGATAFDGAGTGAFASEEVSEVDTTGLGSRR